MLFHSSSFQNGLNGFSIFPDPGLHLWHPRVCSPHEGCQSSSLPPFSSPSQSLLHSARCAPAVTGVIGKWDQGAEGNWTAWTPRCHHKSHCCSNQLSCLARSGESLPCCEDARGGESHREGPPEHVGPLANSHTSHLRGRCSGHGQVCR